MCSDLLARRLTSDMPSARLFASHAALDMFDTYLPCSLCLFYTIINPRYSTVFGRLVSYRVVRRQRDLTLWSATDAPLEERNWRKTTIIIIIIIIIIVLLTPPDSYVTNFLFSFLNK